MCMWTIPFGFCQCGCGTRTAIAWRTNKANNYIKDQPTQYAPGHHAGTGEYFSNGYKKLYIPDHPRSDCNGMILEHILLAERALGRALPAQAQIHHVNGRKDDNRNFNLVICENQPYHVLLHLRANAYRAGFPPSWRWCTYCQQFDAPENLNLRPRGGNAYHRRCHADRALADYHRKKAGC